MPFPQPNEIKSKVISVEQELTYVSDEWLNNFYFSIICILYALALMMDTLMSIHQWTSLQTDSLQEHD